MPTSKGRSGRRRAIPRSAVADKALLLPMPGPAADREILRFHIALERVRDQQSDFDAASLVCQALLVAGLVCESGFGLLPVAYIAEVSSQLAITVERGRDTGVWEFTERLIDDLAKVVNEYDRQLRETRLGVIRQAEADARWAFANRDRLGAQAQRYQRQQAASQK